MLKDLKNTIRQSAIYGLSRIATKLVSFVLLPVYSVYFSVEEYGIISRVETFWQILFAIFSFGLETGLIRWYYKISDTDERKKFLFSASVFLVLINLVFILIFFFTAGIFSELIFLTVQYSSLIFYACLIAVMEAFVFIFFLLLRVNEKAFRYTLFSVLIALFNLLIQIFYIFYTDNKLNGIFIARIISPAIILVMIFPYYVRYLKFGFDIRGLKELIIFSLPIMMAGVFGILLNQSDRYVLGYLSTPSDVGLYSLAFNICGLLNFFIIAPFALAFSVSSWKKYNTENALRFYTKNITYLFFAVTYLALALSLSIPNLIKIFTLNKGYWLAKDIVPWLAIAMPFYGISIIGFFSFYVAKKTYYILYFSIICVSVKIILDIILIPMFQVYGAAVANFISFVLICILNYKFSKRHYFFNYEWVKLFQMVFVYVLLVFPFFYLQLFELTFLNVFLKCLALLAFPFILFILNFYEPVELERLKGFFRKYLKLYRS